MPKIDRLFKDLNQEQQKAISSDGVNLVFAGAGSGKTRTLVYKLANVLMNGFDPNKILALTFTNKAAQEMKQRALWLAREFAQIERGLTRNLSELFVGTFHSWGAKFLRKEVSQSLTIYDDEDSLKLIKEILKKLDFDLDPKFVKETISYNNNRLVDYETFLNENFSNSNIEQNIAEIWKIYEKELRERNAFDFDDLLLCPLKMFLNNSELKEKYQYHYVLVDEFQDTNLPQYLLIKLLVKKYNNLFVVGDDYQSVYGFRGSNYKNILEIENDFPELKTFILGRNYRSTQKIVESANHLILNNKFQKHKKLWTKNKSGENLNIFEAYDEEEESEIVSNVIYEMLQNNLNPSEIAILYRVNFLSRSLEEKFLIKKIPYKIYGGVHFYQRKEIKDILSYLKIFDNPRDLISLKRIINTPPRGIGIKTQNKFFDLGVDKIEKLLIQDTNNSDMKGLDDFLKTYFYIKQLARENSSLTEFLKNLIDAVRYLDYIREDYNRILNISELINVASKFDDIPFQDAFREFLNLSSLWQSNDEIDTNDKIKLMTIHLSKGLEFKNVFIVGMEEGLFPHYKSINDNLFSDNNDLEEERRLAYVAITRAKENVFLSYAKRRRQWGKFTDTIPSRFIKELPNKNINFYGNML